MKKHARIADEVYDLVMSLNDPELGLDWMALKPKLKEYFRKQQKNQVQEK